MMPGVDSRRRLTVVTGADAPFFRTLYQFLQSARRTGVHRRHALVAYDLGLEPSQRAFLEERHAWVEWRRFPFERHPPHVGEARVATEVSPARPVLGGYAWKPILLADVLEERGGLLLWLDAGTLLRRSLDRVVASVSRDGTYVPYSGTGTLETHAHPATRAAVGAYDAFVHRRCRGGGLCAFDASHPDARAVVLEWRRHALDADCIAPHGANLRNHRFDQAILSLLLYQAEARGALRLTDDEQNVSSASPVSFCLVRNKVPNPVPIWLDPALVCLFETRALGDVLVHRARRAWRRFQHRFRTSG